MKQSVWKRVWVSSSLILVSTTSLVCASPVFDGSRNLVCSLTQVVGCTESRDCMEGPARDFDLPALVTIDATKKQLKSAFETGKENVSSINTVKVSKGHLILQGVENGVGWDMAVNGKNGQMRASGVSNELSFLVFGSCTSL